MLVEASPPAPLAVAEYAWPRGAMRPQPGMREHYRGRFVGISACLALAAIAAELLVSANLLNWTGSHYIAEGGALPEKIHPAVYLVLSALIASRIGARGNFPVSRFLQRPLIGTFLSCMVGCLLWMLIFTGPSNLVVLIDSFLPAGFVALAFIDANARTRALLLGLMQLCFTANSVLALIEAGFHRHFVPLFLNGLEYREQSGDFRPTALYDHPLTGAAATLMAFMVIPSGNRVIAAIFILLQSAALLAFGGRTALVAGALCGSWVLGRKLLHAAVSRRGRPGWVLVTMLCTALLAALVVVLVSETGVAERIQAHLFWDASAQVRIRQWDVLGSLDLRQWLMGTTRPELLAHLEMLRIADGVGVVENFWLLLFISLGVLGFPLFLLGLVSLFVWLWRNGNQACRLMLPGVVVVMSTSNSLGRKSTLLVILTATVAAQMSSRAASPGDFGRMPGVSFARTKHGIR